MAAKKSATPKINHSPTATIPRRATPRWSPTTDLARRSIEGPVPSRSDCNLARIPRARRPDSTGLRQTPDFRRRPPQDPLPLPVVEKGQALPDQAQLVGQTQPIVLGPVVPGITRTPQRALRTKGI